MQRSAIKLISAGEPIIRGMKKRTESNIKLKASKPGKSTSSGFENNTAKPFFQANFKLHSSWRK
jgi:hypothetical protein